MINIGIDKIKDGVYRSQDVCLLGRDFTSHGDYVVIKNNINVGMVNRGFEGYNVVLCNNGMTMHSFLGSLESAANYALRVCKHSN